MVEIAHGHEPSGLPPSLGEDEERQWKKSGTEGYGNHGWKMKAGTERSKNGEA